MVLHHHRRRRRAFSPPTARWSRTLTAGLCALAALAITGAALAGCSSGKARDTSVLSTAPGPGASGPFSRNFNPLSPTVGTNGSTSEQLFDLQNNPDEHTTWREIPNSRMYGRNCGPSCWNT